MSRSLWTVLKPAACFGLVASLAALMATPAQAGLFNRRPNVVVVAPTTSYVVADPLVVTSSYVTERVVAVPTSRVYAAPVTEVVVPTTRRVYAAPVADVVVPTTRRVYAAPVVRPTRVVVPSTIIEYYP